MEFSAYTRVNPTGNEQKKQISTGLFVKFLHVFPKLNLTIPNAWGMINDKYDDRVNAVTSSQSADCRVASLTAMTRIDERTFVGHDHWACRLQAAAFFYQLPSGALGRRAGLASAVSQQ